jgi:hypothetical protein
LRNEKFTSLLQENFIELSGAEINQTEVFDILHLEESQKILATNNMKRVFPSVLVSRRRKDGITVYKNVARKCSFKIDANESSLSLYETSEIENIKQVISSVSAELEIVTERLNKHLSAAQIDRDVVRTLLEWQQKLNARIQELSAIRESIYEKEIQRLLCHQTQCESLCANDKDKLNEEIHTFIGFLNIGLEKNLDQIDFHSIFNELPSNVKEKCPILYDVMDTLFLHKKDGRDISKLRVKSAVHSLAILVSLKSQKIQNDFKIMLTCLCISFGAGMRFVNMLNHLGLTVSWDKMMTFFDRRTLKHQDDIAKQTPIETPVFLMFDNINMYRGKHKHLRIFKYIGPTMWNFTGQALLVPNTEGLDEILKCENSCVHPQKSPLQMKAEDIFIENDDEKAETFRNIVDAYLLEILNNALNKIPSSENKLKDMTESELKSILGKATSTLSSKYNIIVPNISELLTCKISTKGNVHVLPLSLEDNSTIVGTMGILDKLAEDFSLPNRNDREYLPFDTLSKTFDLKSARSHFELLVSKRNNLGHIEDMEKLLNSKEMDLEGHVDEDVDANEDLEDRDDSSVSSVTSITLESERRRFDNEDKSFWDTFNSFSMQLSEIHESNSEERYVEFVNSLTNKKCATVLDHLERSLLHVAVEQRNESLSKCLVDMGLDVNCREGCGITPLSVAVLYKNIYLCKFLVESGARWGGPLFTSIPSPMCMAEKLNLTEILELFYADADLSEEGNELISKIDRTCEENISRKNDNSKKSTIPINRSSPGFVTPVVGDVGTCKTNSAVMVRSASYRWVGLCPGDLHNKGYFCEATFKVHGTSGFHYIITEVMKRKKLTKEVFKKRKLQDSNLVQVREAIRDVCIAYGIAAALEFCESKWFPSEHELQSTPDLCCLLLAKFKEWISISSASDAAFQHRSSAFLVYGPILKLYDASTSYGDGYAREVVYQLQLPIYTQLGFKNYSIEVFRHVVNFLAKWPLITRKLLQQNCSVNLSGKEGKGVELDGFVEAEVVQPLKKYVTGHTTVAMCQRLMANIDMLKLVRAAYIGRDGFDVHHTSQHSEQTSFPDQLKGAWFCLQKKFFENTKRQEVECYPLDKKGIPDGKLPKNLINVSDKGKAKIKETFKGKLYECFPDLRYEILS